MQFFVHLIHLHGCSVIAITYQATSKKYMEQVEKSFLQNERGCRNGYIIKKDTNKNAVPKHWCRTSMPTSFFLMMTCKLHG